MAELKITAANFEKMCIRDRGYVMDQIFDRMERGEAWAAPYYAGDYLTMVEDVYKRQGQPLG